MDRPAYPRLGHTARAMTLKMPEEQQFSPTEGFEIRGQSSDSEVYFAAIILGVVLEEGALPVSNGEFPIQV
jgi:hypothetical protein